ncbi:putative ATP-dependent RNA helicase spindle-E, partial [Acipenser ruthenus]
VGLEKVATEHTRLIYMTTGVLLQKLVSAKSLTEFSHIFIDEVHERTEELDFLLLVVRKLLRSNSRYVKVILMSATINCKEFAEYFGTPIRSQINPAYIFEVEGVPYTVDEYYLDDLKRLIPFKVEPSHTEEPYINVEMYNVAVRLIQEFDELEAKEQRLQVYPLHSSVTLEEQNGVFLSPVPGYRKRCPLASTMLKVKQLDMGDPRTLLGTALSPPNLEDIEKTVLQLKEIGALSVVQAGNKESRFDGELTFLGRVLAQLPVDLQLGKMVVLGHVFGCLEECLIIAAALSLKNFFAIPILQCLDGCRSKVTFSGSTLSDPIALANAFKAWYTSRKKGEFRHPKFEDHRESKMLFDYINLQDELDWGKANYIQIKRIREVAELFEDLKQRVAQFNMHISTIQPAMDYEYTHKQRFILQVVISGAFYPNYFTLGPIDEEMASKDMSGNDPTTTVLLRSIPPYGFLYYKQLQSLFRQCGQVKSISFDGSRVNVDFQNDTVCPVGILSSSIDPTKLPPNPVFIINITEVVEVGHFWGFKADESSVQSQRKLTAEINTLELKPLFVSPYPNLFCLAPFTESEEMRYYRAKVIYVAGNSVEVFFVDYGNTAKVSCTCLREMPADLMKHPFQAQEFLICKIRPSAKSMILGDQWSRSARNRFITLVNGRTLIVTLFSILHNVMRVDLSIDTDTVNTRVGEILVQEGYAEPAEESFESKDLKEGTFVPNATSSSWKTSKEQEKELINRLLEIFSKVNPGSLKSRVPLHGPTSSYKLKFHSMSKISQYRTDEGRTRFTGALCGLGWNRVTSAPILPEHDIELAFDTQFDVADIAEVNGLRNAINKLVCQGPSGPLHLGRERIAKLQEDAREKLIRLFTKLPTRENLIPQYYEKPNKWNQVRLLFFFIILLSC